MTGPRRKATDSSLVQGPVKSTETIWGISTGYLSREMGDASAGKNAVTQDLLIIGSKMHLRLEKHRKNLEEAPLGAGLGYLPLKELGLRCLRGELAELMPVPLRDARRWAPEAGAKCC